MLDAISGLFSGNALSVLGEDERAALTLLIVIPALHEALPRDHRRGVGGDPDAQRQADHPARSAGLRATSSRGRRPAPGHARRLPDPLLVSHGRCARAIDRSPAAEPDGRRRHQHLVHASFDWRPIVSGHDLRVLELDVVDVRERAGNIVGAALRDIVHDLDGAVLPPNALLSPRIVAACADRVRADCGIELLGVLVTGDALTDGYLLSKAISPPPCRTESRGMPRPPCSRTG